MIGIELKTEFLNNPLGIDICQPRLSWICADGKFQTGYQVKVMCGGSIEWDSGLVSSGEMHCTCQVTMASRHRYTWQVRLWDEQKQAGSWSEEAFFETGILTATEWEAKWIRPETEEFDTSKRQPASYLRRSFCVPNTDHARLYITCHGLYVAWINGRRVGNHILTPGVNNYYRKLEYQTYDVSELLHVGENEILVALGDGWYRGGNGYGGERNVYGTHLSLLCQLEIGGIPVLISDGDWQASQSGPVRENDLQQGEIYDARMEKIALWHGVNVFDESKDILACSNNVPIREQECFTGRIITTPNGETVVDFGQNLAGYVQLSVIAREGQRITLHHGETLDKYGNFTNENFQPGGHHADGHILQRTELICKEGRNVYKPSFTIFGFRYAKITTDIDLTDAEFTAYAVYSDMKQTGWFECSDESVNRLVHNSLWSQKSNFCDVPTDCPTRERSAFTGDIGVYVSTALFLMDAYSVLRKWLQECRFCQKPDGRLPSIIPPVGRENKVSELFSGSVGWGDACVIVPYTLYKVYGDAGILRENYEMMKRWVDYLRKRAKKTHPRNWFKRNPYRKFTVDVGIDWGEWVEPGTNETDTLKSNVMKGTPEVGTAYLSQSSRMVSEAAAVLGMEADAELYEQVAEKAMLGFRWQCTKNGRISSDRQHHYVRPLAFGLLEGEDAQQCAGDLNAMVLANGCHLNTGFLSTPHLCNVLSAYGYTDTAYRLLLQDTYPSWLYAVKKGATTIWENWDGINGNGDVKSSFNHYSFGAVTGWLFGGVCGIRLNAGKLEIRPQPNPLLRFARCRYHSPFGTIESSWEYTNKGICYKFTVPVNMTANVMLHDGMNMLLEPGVHTYFC